MANFAINPQTGEAVRWDGQAWVPTQVATNPSTGQKAVWDGATWADAAGSMAQASAAPAAQPAEGPGFFEAIGKRNLDRGAELAGGLVNAIGQFTDPVGDFINQNIPMPTPEADGSWSFRTLTPEEVSSPNVAGQLFSEYAVKPAKEAVGYVPYVDGKAGIIEPFKAGDYGTALSNVPAFAAEQFLGGIPDMAGALLAPGAYTLARTGEIASDRAANDERAASTWEDMAYAAPVAVGTTLLERIGLGGIMAPSGSVLTAPLKAGGKEAATEAVQEGAEYGATTIDTVKGFDPTTALEMSALGALGGGPAGAVASVPFMLNQTQAGPGSSGVNPPASGAAASPSSPVQPPTTQARDEPRLFSEPPAQAPAPVPAQAPAPAAVATPTEQAPPAAPAQPPAVAPEPPPVAAATETPAPAAPTTKAPERVFTPDNSMSADVEYEVVDASQLQAATGDLQPRDRTRAGSDTQIANMAGNLDPEQLLASRESDRGAPIIDETNTVLSGNGRVAAIRRAAEANPEKYEAYRARLQQEGYNTEGMQTPVLVRRTKALTPEQKREFVVKSNKDGKLAMSPAEQAKVDANLVDENALANYRADAEINSAANVQFVRSVIGRLPPAEQAAFVGADGTLSPQGASRIQSAVFAKAYDSADLTNRIVEGGETGSSVKNALLGAAGKWAQMRQQQSTSSPNVASLDITKELVDAVGLVGRIQQMGQGVKGSKPDFFFSQQDMLNKASPVTEKLARLFYNASGNRIASADDIVASLSQYVDSVMRQGNAAGDMFGSAPTAESIVDGLLAARSRKEAPPPEQQLGFGLSNRKPVATEPPPAAKGEGDAQANMIRQIAQAKAEAETEAQAAPNQEATVTSVKRRTSPEGTDYLVTLSDGRTATIYKSKPESDGGLGAWHLDHGGVFAFTQSSPEYVSSVLGYTREEALANVAKRLTQSEEAAAKKNAKRRPTRAAEGVADAMMDAEAEAEADTEIDTEAETETDEDTDNAPLADTIDTRSYANRASRYEDAWADMGLNPDEMVNAPAPKQIRSLVDALQRVFGIKTTVEGSVTRQGIDQMLDGYRNMRWMAHVMGIPAQGMSIGGRLSLSLVKNLRGARGMYDPGKNEITLPGRSRSFAHEWSHYLDHILLNSLPLAQIDTTTGLPTKGQLSSGKTRVQGLDRDAGPVEEAFVLLMNTIFLDDAKVMAEIARLQVEAQQTKKDGTPTVKALEAKKRIDDIMDAIDKGNLKLGKAYTAFRQGAGKMGGEYYKKPTELMARAFEAYIGHKMALMRAAGETATDEFITKEDRTYIDQSIAHVAQLFPQGTDRDNIFMAFDRLFNELVNDGFFGAGQAASKPTNNNITNPSTWGRYVDPNDQKVKTAANQYRAQRAKMEEFMENLGLDPRNFNAKATAATAGERTGAMFKAAFLSMGGRMRLLAKGNAALQELADHFEQGRELGRTVKQTYEEAVNARSKSMLNKITNELVGRFGNDRLSRQLRATLRDALIGINNNATSSDPNVVAAAANIRRLLNDLWYDMKDAGLDVGWKAGYLPRMYDEALIWDDENGFIEAATKVYADQFDQEVGTDASKVKGKDLKDLGIGTKRLPVPPTIKQMLKAKDKAGFYAANQAAIDQEFTQLREDYSATAAGDWNNRIRIGSPVNFETRGPEGNFLKKRELPASADKLLEKYMVNDPVDALSQYILSANRRLEFSKRFGPRGEKLDAMIARAEKLGAHPESLREFRDMIETITGRGKVWSPWYATKFAAVVHAIGTLALMPRAVLASLAEPMMAGIRTGDGAVTLKAMQALISDVRQGFNAVRGQPLTDDKVKARREIADFLGITTNAMFDTMIANRMGSAAEVTPRIGAIMSNFYRLNGLTALTNSQRRGMVAGASFYLKKLSERAVAGGDAAKTAQRELRELGITDFDALKKFHDTFAEIPTVDQLEANGIGADWGAALSRLIDQIIQDPKRVDKPQLASDPVFRLMFGLMSFSYAVARNVMLPSIRRARNIGTEQGATLATKHTAAVAANLAALIVVQSVMSDLLRSLMDPDYDERKEERSWAGYFMQGVQRSGVLGAADPLVNFFNSVKYDANATNLMVGAQAGFLLGAIDRMMVPFLGKNSENTLTAERNAFKAAYEAMFIPLAGTILGAMPGGPIARGSAGFMLGVASTKRAKEEIADTVVGEKPEKK